MEKGVGQGLDWAGLPVITIAARLLPRTRQNSGHRLPAEGAAGVGGAWAANPRERPYWT